MSSFVSSTLFTLNKAPSASWQLFQGTSNEKKYKMAFLAIMADFAHNYRIFVGTCNRIEWRNDFIQLKNKGLKKKKKKKKK